MGSFEKLWTCSSESPEKYPAVTKPAHFKEMNTMFPLSVSVCVGRSVSLPPTPPKTVNPGETVYEAKSQHVARLKSGREASTVLDSFGLLAPADKEPI